MRTMQWFFRIAVASIYIGVLLAFLAPYAPNEQHRDVPAAPPTPIHFLPGPGGFRALVVYRQIEWPPASGRYREDPGVAFPCTLVSEK